MKIKDERTYMIVFVANSGSFNNFVVQKYNGEVIEQFNLSDVGMKVFNVPECVYFHSGIESLTSSDIKVYVNGERKTNSYLREDSVGDYTLAGFHAGDYVVVVK